MKIILPSLGVLGCKSVDMNQPTISSLRAVGSMNQEPDLLKVQYVKLLCPDLDLTKITYYDLMYLYQVAVFASNLNTVSYTFTCPKCGEKIAKRTYTFGSQDVHTLEKIKLPYEHAILGKTYQFRLLSAQDFLDCVVDALVEDDYDEALSDAIVARVLSMTVEEVRNIDLSIYLYAYLFHKTLFHGVRLIDNFTCTNDKCLMPLSVELNLDPRNVLHLSAQELFEDYKLIQDKISFDEFMSFTIPEYKAFIESLS